MAAPLSLATTHRISVDFFSYGYLDVSVRHVRSAHPMYSDVGAAKAAGFPIRTSPDYCLLPAPRSFSQAITSFFASNRLGIHYMHLFT